LKPAGRTAALFCKGTRLLTDAAAGVGALTVLVLLGLVCYGVAWRYLLNQPQSWVDELIGYVLVASVMFSVAEALRTGEHICVDVLTEKLGPAGKRAVAVFGLVCVLICAAILLSEGWATVAFSRMLGIRSIGHLNVPIWIVQILIPVGGALLLFAALAELVRIAAGLPAAAPDETTEARSLDRLISKE
jgi:TRAP-type C4-dicarboxylate transport system permease small subunit